ncbi:hypothetical protein MKW94_010869 [Papaver nudicaule]|uniref:Uncharacterized protein n=1 Tax=Papaver nudicaule TaxID=74823 RepID=A0AA41VJH1_PAPNU|nr:hypothetical protein [Papaver nudicaule]
MVRLLTLDSVHHHGGYCSVPVVAIALFVSATVLVALCAKHTIRRRQLATEKLGCKSVANPEQNSSLMKSPGRFFATVSNKVYKKKGGGDHEYDDDKGDDGGLWQRGILMGEKCQPPDFSGMIYYDVDGRQLSEIPRSPRAGGLPSSFSFPVAKDGGF